MPEVGFTTATAPEIKAICKKQEAEIATLSLSVKKKRQQLKKFSDSINKLLEKKLVPSNPYLTQQLRPKFNPRFENPQLRQLHAQRQSLHSQIADVKQKIAAYKSEEEPEVIEEIRKKESIMQKLQKEEQKVLQEKQFLRDKMEKNKQILEYFKNSPCLKEIEQNKEELQEIRKQMKMMEKQSNQMLSEEVQINMFHFEMKNFVERVQKELDPDERPVDPKVINKLIEEINAILEERKIVERQHSGERQGLDKKIAFVTRNNMQLQRQLRQMANSELQKALDEKKKKIRNHRSTLLLHKQPIIKKQAKPVEKRQMIQPWQNEKDEIEQKQQIEEIEKSFNQQRPNSSSRTIIIGNWNEENGIKDDIIAGGNISRAVGLKILTKNKKIVGIGATYINKIGVEIIGRGNIWKSSKNKEEDEEEQFQIDLEDVEWLRYSKRQNASIGLKWQLKNGQSITVGKIGGEEETESILLNDHWAIKTAEFCLDQNFVNICGIKLRLIEYKMDNPEEKGKQPIGKWRSTSDIGLTKKKVFVKGNHTKRGSDVTQVDHRLLLNRKKKMV